MARYGITLPLPLISLPEHREVLAELPGVGATGTSAGHGDRAGAHAGTGGDRADGGGPGRAGAGAGGAGHRRVRAAAGHSDERDPFRRAVPESARRAALSQAA